jgi:hypothetical protein
MRMVSDEAGTNRTKQVAKRQIQDEARVLYNKMGGLSKIEFILDMSLICM